MLYPPARGFATRVPPSPSYSGKWWRWVVGNWGAGGDEEEAEEA